MRKRRLFENVVEFLLLCLVLFLYFWLMVNLMIGENSENGGSDIALGFGLGLIFYFIRIYALTFLVNLVLQSVFLTNSYKTKKRYYGTKIVLFAVITLVVPTLLRIAYEPGLVISLYLFIDYFILSFIVFLFFFIPYVIIITLFYFLDKKRKIQNTDLYVETIES